LTESVFEPTIPRRLNWKLKDRSQLKLSPNDIAEGLYNLIVFEDNILGLAVRSILQLYFETQAKDRALGIPLTAITAHMQAEWKTETKERQLYDALQRFRDDVENPREDAFLSIDKAKAYLHLDKLRTKVRDDWNETFSRSLREFHQRETMLANLQRVIELEASYAGPNRPVYALWEGEESFQRHVRALINLAIEETLPIRIMTSSLSSLNIFEGFKELLQEVVAKGIPVEALLHRSKATKETKEWLKRNKVALYERGDTEFANVHISKFLLVGNSDGITVESKDVFGTRSGHYFRNSSETKLYDDFQRVKDTARFRLGDVQKV